MQKKAKMQKKNANMKKIPCKFRFSKEMVAIIVVSAFPPKESRRTEVRIEFRYGI